MRIKKRQSLLNWRNVCDRTYFFTTADSADLTITQVKSGFSDLRNFTPLTSKVLPIIF